MSLLSQFYPAGGEGSLSITDIAGLAGGYPTITPVDAFIVNAPVAFGGSGISTGPTTQTGGVAKATVASNNEIASISSIGTGSNSAMIFQGCRIAPRTLIGTDGNSFGGQPAVQEWYGLYRSGRDWTTSPISAVTNQTTELRLLCAGVRKIGLSVLSVSDITLQNASSLEDTSTSVIACSQVTSNNGTHGTRVSIVGAKLNAESVSKILVDCDSMSILNWGFGQNSGIFLNGGSSAGVSSLTSAGAAARASLLAKGATVSLNA